MTNGSAASKPMHILSADQFSPAEIAGIFKSADNMKAALSTEAGRKKLIKLHEGRQIATLFYQPSTRTRVSFEAGAMRLGVTVVSTENALESSSANKGETIEDTAKILSGYGVDAIVLRYNEAGGSARAASVSSAAVINAGDGRDGEHPTQALFDAYTIDKNIGRLENLKVVFGGDVLQSRCVRSLSIILSKYKNNHFSFLSAPEFQVSEEVLAKLKKAGVSYKLTSDMKEAFADADVIYWTRLQAEYLKDKKSLVELGMVIDKSSLKLMPAKAIIMHPLPRVDEITPDVDDDPRAKYFEQAANGLYVRMALMDMIFNG
jgi:aspartate carbamoyltransferase catalytic subunit